MVAATVIPGIYLAGALGSTRSVRRYIRGLWCFESFVRFDSIDLICYYLCMGHHNSFLKYIALLRITHFISSATRLPCEIVLSTQENKPLRLPQPRGGSSIYWRHDTSTIKRMIAHACISCIPNTSKYVCMYAHLPWLLKATARKIFFE